MGSKRKTLASDDDHAQTSAVAGQDTFKCNIFGDGSINGRTYERRGNNESSGTNSSSSFGISEMVSILKDGDEALLCSYGESYTGEQTNAVTDCYADSEMEKMFPQENLAPYLTNNSLSIGTAENYVMLGNCDSHEYINRALPNKTNSEMSSNSNLLEANNATHTSQPVVASIDSNKASISYRSNSKIAELKSNINGEPIPNDAVQPMRSLLDNSSDTQQSDVVSAEGSLKLLSASSKEGASVPPSPIRGLVEDLHSPNVPLKQHNKLDSCNEEGANFSFRMENKVFKDDSLRSDSTEARSLGARDGPDHVNLTFDRNNTLDNKHKHNDESICEEKEPASSSTYSEMTSDQVVSSSLAALPTTETLLICPKKKLIVLDLNGLLADIKQDFRNAHQAQKRVGGKSVFKRPFCDDFLEFCFERFHVGVWSSRRRYNVDAAVDYLMGNLRQKLLFCWDQSKCTYTGYGTLDNIHKPLVLKELEKLWKKEEYDLPWEKGEFSPSNTLLVDDSPYKAICNPPHTAIFPYPYIFPNDNDNSLGAGGDLRVYLEGLAIADDVQLYVQRNPFGQKTITDSDPSWNFYLQIINNVLKYSSLTT
ncbi:hypothetical protein Cni_G16518 [Canna indica]|uniref:Mitochondrial import inner membrane translocase subunit TIM50 n=1 Tax=Canna indica TaxID=4628 RepID=A0AAQ3QGV3_9LILI|nr:hypothetical protein Cni_G16518 [Canna indica]